METQQSTPVKFLPIWLTVFSPVMYLGMCEIIAKIPVKGGEVFHGFAPMEPHVYNMIKYGAMILAVIFAACIASLRMSISSGIPSGPLAMLLKPLEEAKFDIDTAITGVLVTITSLCNAIAIYGVVLFLLSGIKADAYPFLAGAFIIMIFLMPTKMLVDQMRRMRRE